MSFSTAQTVCSHNTSKLDNENDLEVCLKQIFKKFACPVAVTVDEYHQQRKSASRIKDFTVKRKRTIVTPPTPYAQSLEMTNTQKHSKEIYLTMTAVYNVQNHLVELMITNFKEIVPRMVIQVLTLIITNYAQLTKFTIKKCCIDENIVHELVRMLPYSAITDICLDDCKLNNTSFEHVLKAPTTVKNLSLCRCNISALECEHIAAMLRYPEFAEKHLVALNLTSNKIGNKGAKYLADALRTNRHLRYLNLANNCISDRGAMHMFHYLQEFPLTLDENMDRRRRHFLYLKKKQEIYAKCLHIPASFKKLEQKNCKRSQSQTTLIFKQDAYQKPKNNLRKLKSSSVDSNEFFEAEMMARQIIGPFQDPFDPSSLRLVDGYPFCLGNFTLNYLNLAYNNLMYPSLKTLLNVVEHQKHHRTPTSCGLMKLILDGNRLPVECEELLTIQQILNESVNCSAKTANRRNERTTNKK